MLILGISAFYHDSAACLLRDGVIVAAAQEERFSRIKHDSSFPYQAIHYCLSEGGVNLEDVDHIVFYEKPFLKFERLLETYLAFAPHGLKSFLAAMPVWTKEKLFQRSLLKKALKEFLPDGSKHSFSLLFTEHHQSHAASAFFPSPFKKAIVVTADGVGEWLTTSLSTGEGNKLRLLKELSFPHSLGLLYSAFTYYTGFRVNSGEYKVMGLAPYGRPIYTDLIYKNLIDVKEDGSFRLNMKYFDYCTGLAMVSSKFCDLFGGPPRRPESELTQKEMDLAASIQVVTEEIMLKIIRHAVKVTGIKNLCLAGGVALNCVANGRLLKESGIENIWIQPAAGDAGGSLGACYSVWYEYLNNTRRLQGDQMQGAYLGPSYSNESIHAFAQKHKLPAQYLEDSELFEYVSNQLGEGKVIGWFSGRMEFGPRSLGSRSILGDPRNKTMQSTMNLKIKYRESFRPFAPSILREHLSDWFDLDVDSPYMLLVAQVKKEKCFAMSEKEKELFGIDKLNVIRSEIPAVTHIDYSARVQTVHSSTNPRYHALLSKFYQKTGCPILVNTSFNVRGEPVVCSPEDAYGCFMGTEMDLLVMENYVFLKSQQPPLTYELLQRVSKAKATD